jgi:exodeoxyribonuclease VII small subunit
MSKQPKSVPEASFEKALAELESLVAKMEDGGLSLEQSLAAHKRGLELAKQCRERLEAAQQQVKVLEGEVLKPLLAASDGGDRD